MTAASFSVVFETHSGCRTQTSGFEIIRHLFLKSNGRKKKLLLHTCHWPLYLIASVAHTPVDHGSSSVCCIQASGLWVILILYTREMLNTEAYRDSFLSQKSDTITYFICFQQTRTYMSTHLDGFQSEGGYSMALQGGTNSPGVFSWCTCFLSRCSLATLQRAHHTSEATSSSTSLASGMSCCSSATLQRAHHTAKYTTLCTRLAAGLFRCSPFNTATYTYST